MQTRLLSAEPKSKDLDSDINNFNGLFCLSIAFGFKAHFDLSFFFQRLLSCVGIFVCMDHIIRSFVISDFRPSIILSEHLLLLAMVGCYGGRR